MEVSTRAGEAEDVSMRATESKGGKREGRGEQRRHAQGREVGRVAMRGYEGGWDGDMLKMRSRSGGGCLRGKGDEARSGGLWVISEEI